MLTPLFCLRKVVCLYRSRNSLSSSCVKQLGSGDVPGGNQANGTNPCVRTLLALSCKQCRGADVCYIAWNELSIPSTVTGIEEWFCLSDSLQGEVATSLN